MKSNSIQDVNLENATKDNKKKEIENIRNSL